jgi:hypothetical protein
MTNDDGMTRRSVFARVIECAEAMAQELQETLDAMREASGDDRDGEHLELLLAEWESIQRLLREWESSR